jgi:hypothetical protein
VLLPFNAKKPIFPPEQPPTGLTANRYRATIRPTVGKGALWRSGESSSRKSNRPRVDGKSVNARVEFALENHNRAIPAQDHPWKKKKSRALDMRLTPPAQFKLSKENLPTEIAIP